MKQAICLVLSVIGMVASQSANTTDSAHNTGDVIAPAERDLIKGLREYISESTCDFYQDFDGIFDYCGAEGYAIGFGYKYCNAFLENRAEF